MKLKDQIAVITGGGTGMGAGAARVLAAQDVTTCLLGRRLQVLENTAAEVGGSAFRCDVSDAEALDAVFDSIEDRLGTPRILVHAAANGSMPPLLVGRGEACSREALREIIETNVLGTLYANQVFAERLSRIGRMEDGLRGLIVNVTSIGALDGVVGSSYVTSKAAVNGLCLSLARELSGYGIRVMTIAPGGIDTPMFRGGANEAVYELMASSVPALERLGTPLEFGELVRHICENDYLNGSIIRLDGGMRIPFVKNVGKDTAVLDQADHSD